MGYLLLPSQAISKELIKSGAARTQISTHMGCWPCRQWLKPLCHNASPKPPFSGSAHWTRNSGGCPATLTVGREVHIQQKSGPGCHPASVSPLCLWVLIPKDYASWLCPHPLSHGFPTRRACSRLLALLFFFLLQPISGKTAQSLSLTHLLPAPPPRGALPVLRGAPIPILARSCEALRGGRRLCTGHAGFPPGGAPRPEAPGPAGRLLTRQDLTPLLRSP